jgi:hypothetical protein
MMRLYLKRKRTNIEAVVEYDPAKGTFTVLKGSIVSKTVAHTAKFRGADSIEKYRKDTVKNNAVTKDVVFKSASTAANYVTGASTNGLIAWKNEKGTTLKELLAAEE